MKKIVLISCVSKKLPHRAKAKDLYVSPLFKYCLGYAQSLNPNDIYILSAKHGLLDLEQVIGPYEQTLNTMRSKEVKEWASKVLNQLNEVADLKRDEFIFLAGQKYRRYLVPHIANYKIPLEKLSIGKQLKYLKQKLSK
jgi:hypothetical protein